MAGWLRKLWPWGHEAVSPADVTAVAAQQAETQRTQLKAVPGDWDPERYRALRKRYYRSLIRVQLPVVDEAEDDELPQGQAGIDIEGLDKRLARIALDAMQELDDPAVTAKYLPRQPNILPKLVGIMRDPDSTANELVGLIHQDPGFVAQVLNLANSAFFRRTKQPLDNLHSAVVNLGETGLQSLVNATLMQPILQPQGGRIRGLSDKLYEHALICAQIGLQYAPQESQPSSLVHLFGLLQAIGDITLLTFLTKRYDNLTEDEMGCVFHYLGLTHAKRISLATTAQWNMGDEMENALRFLIKPERDTTGFARYCGRIHAASLVHVLFNDGVFRQDTAVKQARLFGFDALVLRPVSME